MSRIIVTGGPGTGKTTLLAALEAQGCATVAESARAVIEERLAAHRTPRPPPAEFAAEILRRDLLKHDAVFEDGRPTFFDRSAVESLAMAVDSGHLTAGEAARLRQRLRFSRLVFVAPPWRAIYVTDAARDHTFEHCERVHEALLRCYAEAGYRLLELPRSSIEARAAWLLARMHDVSPC